MSRRGHHCRPGRRLLFCQLFFPERPARMTLLVPDWMNLSTEVYSLQSSYEGSLRLNSE